MKKNLLKSNLSQVWIETSVYILLGLIIIVIILSIANPQIEKIKDRSVVRQAIEILEVLDGKILEIEQSVGSVSVPKVTIGKGKIIINSTNDSIAYVLEDTPLEFSQLGSDIKEGNLVIKTEKYGKKFVITVVRYYEEINITYKDMEKNVFLEPSSVPYKIRMENKGKNPSAGKIIIDFNLI